MRIFTEPCPFAEALFQLRGQGKTLGLVPTMGALHEGHLALVRRSKKENDVTAVSIFVNPTQFGPQEDFKRYPRPLARDLAMLRKAKVDYVFTPSVRGIYPAQRGKVPAAFGRKGLSLLMKNLCGKFRPGHFQGVVQVVTRLFEIIRPTRAYFGEKDYQQLQVLRHMNQALPFGIRIRSVATVREKDGLAMSSRNRYLSPEERGRARVISQTLFRIRREIRKGGLPLRRILSQARQELHRAVDQVQYLEAVDAEKLRPLRKRQFPMAVLTACFVGKTRLIDNVIIQKIRGERIGD